MRCYYCDGNTDHAERINNSKRPVCDSVDCQYRFQQDEDEQKSRDRKYDDWRTRPE
jgi:hypothetical protein